ncbi:hypothetical protein LEP1GSC133_2837 [Leptospira borgpetersenii serovar Pomona str. 200901868]|uniref:Uncharacterized protein n=2 Tax=Leptospira borgpetersenii TaxID=174 RepID=M3FIF4_LEPBO|nr:hypothetical protein LEP1GSC123_3963 [Leptospira borgpetersenii str. 200701203]EMO65019.1 hypothetical protein LEP1GSC133_2837 [Leptospira borgpetersenii serovar Pomona str. 200901868]
MVSANPKKPTNRAEIGKIALILLLGFFAGAVTGVILDRLTGVSFFLPICSKKQSNLNSM